MPFRFPRLKAMFAAVLLIVCLAPGLSRALDSTLAQALEQHVAGMATVTEQNYYDTYRPFLERSWNLIRALHDARAPAERIRLAEQTVAMLRKTPYPDTETIQKFDFERFFALYQLGRGPEAEKMLGVELFGQFLRNYLPQDMQDITARAAFRQGEISLENGNLEGAPWIFAEAARDYQKLEGDNSANRIAAIAKGVLSSAMNGRLSHAGEALNQALGRGNLSPESAGALAAAAGQVALLAGDAEKAAAYFDQALPAKQRNTPPHDGEAFGIRLAAAHAYLNTGQTGKAGEIVTTLYPFTPGLELLARMHRLAGRIALAENNAPGAKASILEALKSIDPDPLQNFALRGALLSDYAAVGGGADLSDPFPMVGSGTESLINVAERLIAERRYQAALDTLAPLSAAGDLSLSQQGRLSLALSRAEFGLHGPTPEFEAGLQGRVEAGSSFPDSVRAGLLDLAFETAMRNRHWDAAGALLGQLEELVFAHRPEGHPDLFRVASLNAALYYKLYATNDFYGETGQQIAMEYGKLVVAASRDFGLISPVGGALLMPQVTFGIWEGSEWVSDFVDGVARVPHTDLLIAFLTLHDGANSSGSLAIKYERALAILANLAQSQGEDYQPQLNAGLALLNEILAAQEGRGPSHLAAEAAYLRSLFNGGAPRDTDIIRAKKALDARGFDPRAVMAILFGAPTAETPHMANVLRAVIEAEYGIAHGDDSWGGFAASMMADLAFDPETGTHFGFAPFDAQSYPQTRSVLERSAAISDCFRNARPWADCTLTYAPLAGYDLTAAEAEECRVQALQAEQHSEIYARYEPQAFAAEAQEKYDLANAIREKRDAELQQSGLMSIFPSCWVYEKGPGVIDPEAGKVKPQIDLTRVILKKKKKEE